MKESTTYQAILMEGRAEGRIEQAKRMILLSGGDRFGPADEETRATLDAIQSIERLERIAIRLLHAAGWPELLATP